MTKLFAKAEFNVFNNHLGLTNQWSSDDVDKLEVVDLKKYQDIVKQCNFFYRRDPIASTVVNKLVEIGITDLMFDKGQLSDNEFRIFTSLEDQLQAYAEECALQYIISGMVVPEIEYETKGKEYLNSLGIKKYSALTLPSSMWVRNPATIKINSPMIGSKPSYFVILPDELVFFIMNKGVYPDGTKDIALYESLKTHYPEFVSDVENHKKEILLENDLIVRRKTLPDSPYPLPYLYPVLEALKHKRNLRRMDYSIASRVISAIQLVRLGNDTFPVTEDDQSAFTSIQSQMAWRNSNGKDLERVFQLFANHTLQIDWVYPPFEALLNDKKYAEVNQDIFFGLGFPRILTTGETERTGSSDPEFATISPIKTMNNLQSNIIGIIKAIIIEVANANGIKNYPEIRFKPINLNTFKNFVEGMTSLYDSGNLSRTSFSEEFGYNWDEEIKLKAEENKTLKKLGVEEFAPQPFSPKPNNGNTGNKPEQKANPKPDNKPQTGQN